MTDQYRWCPRSSHPLVLSCGISGSPVCESAFFIAWFSRIYPPSFCVSCCRCCRRCCCCCCRDGSLVRICWTWCGAGHTVHTTKQTQLSFRLGLPAWLSSSWPPGCSSDATLTTAYTKRSSWSGVSIWQPSICSGRGHGETGITTRLCESLAVSIHGHPCMKLPLLQAIFYVSFSIGLAATSVTTRWQMLPSSRRMYLASQGRCMPDPRRDEVVKRNSCKRLRTSVAQLSAD